MPCSDPEKSEKKQEDENAEKLNKPFVSPFISLQIVEENYALNRFYFQGSGI